MPRAQAEPEIDAPDMHTRAHGRLFYLAVVGAWPLGVAIGLVATLFGAGMTVAIASGLCVALGLNFVWVVITFAVDDGNADDRLRSEVDSRAVLDQQDAEVRAALERNAQEHNLR